MSSSDITVWRKVLLLHSASILGKLVLQNTDGLIQKFFLFNKFRDDWFRAMCFQRRYGPLYLQTWKKHKGTFSEERKLLRSNYRLNKTVSLCLDWLSRKNLDKVWKGKLSTWHPKHIATRTELFNEVHLYPENYRPPNMLRLQFRFFWEKRRTFLANRWQDDLK